MAGWRGYRCGRCARSRPSAACRVDMHCDETDDPLSRHIETLAPRDRASWPAGARRWLAPDLACIPWTITMSSKLLPLIAEAEHQRASPNPLINIVHAGTPRHLSQAPRHDPRAGAAWRWGSPLPSARIACMDPWYVLGSGDMLEVAHMGRACGADDEPGRHARLLRCGDGRTPARHHWASRTTASAVGCNGRSRVAADARDPVEAIRLQARPGWPSSAAAR